MNTSDIINLILMISTIVLSLASITIVIISINQNKKMIEISTRPNINIYGAATYYGEKRNYYLVVRNYGKSSGRIVSITPDVDLSKFAIDGFLSPFSFISNLTLAPDQGYSIVLNPDVFRSAKEEQINIVLQYEGLGKIYKETTTINIRYIQNNVATKWNGNPVETISGTLQDIANRTL